MPLKGAKVHVEQWLKDVKVNQHFLSSRVLFIDNDLSLKVLIQTMYMYIMYTVYCDAGTFT